MKQIQSFTSIPSWVKPLLLVAVAAIATGACKSTVSTGGVGIPVPTGGMPGPSGPSTPPSGGSSGGSSGGGPESPMPQGGGIPGGGGSPGGSSGPSGESGGSDGSGGDVGSFPEGEDPAGVPPPPSSTGAGGETSAGDVIDGESEEESEWDEETDAFSDCGDSGELPGGIGGMGQDLECMPGGGGASGGEDAEGGGQGTGGAGELGEFPDESDAERAARLGQELDESIGGFDEAMQEEQRDISAAGRNTEGFGPGGTGGSGAAGSGGISLGEQGGNSNSISVANSTMSRESPIDDMTQDEIRERTPEDIPILVDDDIIARQLREAALAENDPELRERLWEEYRKYSGI